MSEHSVAKPRKTPTALTVNRLADGEQPPPSARRGSVYDEIAEQLRARPGVWARLDGGRGVSASLRKRGLSVTERANGNGAPVIYARFCTPEG